MSDLTVVQKREIAQGAQAMGAIARRYARRRSHKVVSPLSTLSFWGKSLAVSGALAAIAFAGLVVLQSSQIATESGQVGIVARETVNVRQTPSTKSNVVLKAHSGDRFNITNSSGKWTKVRSTDGKTAGWIASSLINTDTAKTFVYRYEMKGYGTYFLISMFVVFFALRMKRNVVHPEDVPLIDEEI